MKRGTLRHPKLLDLASLLNLPPFAALGLMEALLHWACDFAVAGDVGRYSDEAIARGIGWTGASTDLIDALVTCGWLERCAQHRLVVHDLHDHADDVWRKRLQRVGGDFVRASHGAPSAPPKRRKRPESHKTSDRTTADNGGQCPPDSAERRKKSAYQTRPDQTVPDQTGEEVPARSLTLAAPPRGGVRAGPAPPQFEAFWDAYPRKVAKAAALAAWRKLGPDPPLEPILQALDWQRRSAAWLEGGGAFVPHPASWLNGQRWLDEPPREPVAFATRQTAGNAAALAAFLGGGGST